MFSLKLFCILLVAYHISRTWVGNGRLQGLKLTMENYKTVTPNCGRRRLLDVVVYKRFQLQSSDWEFFLMGCRLREVIAHGGSDFLFDLRSTKKNYVGHLKL